jgi:hypothetical protein
MTNLNKYIDPMISRYFKLYNSLIIEFNTNMQQDEFKEVLFLINEIFNTNIDDAFMNCSVEYFGDENEEEFYIVVQKYNHFTWNWGLLSYLLIDKEENNYIFNKIFNYKNVNTKTKIEDILINGDITPSYRPRRIERTLEAITYYYNPITREKTTYPYRFKTEEELDRDAAYKREYSWYFSDYSFSFVPQMIYLCGKTLEKKFPINQRYIRTDDEEWTIHLGMLEKNELIAPEYKPKKFKRTLESFSTFDIKNSTYFNYYNTLFIQIKCTDEIVKSIDEFKKVIHKLEDIFDVIFSSVISIYYKFRENIDIYIRFTKRTNDMSCGYSEMENMKEIAYENNYTYKKLYTIDEIIGDLDNNLFNFLNMIPTYKSRKISREI